MPGRAQKETSLVLGKLSLADFNSDLVLSYNNRPCVFIRNTTLVSLTYHQKDHGGKSGLLLCLPSHPLLSRFCFLPDAQQLDQMGQPFLPSSLANARPVLGTYSACGFYSPKTPMPQMGSSDRASVALQGLVTMAVLQTWTLPVLN